MRRAATVLTVALSGVLGLASDSGAAATHFGPTPADTVVEVVPGDRLEVTRLQGELRIIGSDDPQSIRLEQASGDPVALLRRDGVVHLEPARDPDASVVLRIPAGMSVRVQSRDLDLVVEQLDGATEIDVLDGRITVRRGRGQHQLRLADGDVELRDLTGSADLLLLDGDVRVIGGAASLEIEVTDGDLTLRPDRVGSTLTASTLDGDVTLSGPVPNSSTVALSTHDGDVIVMLSAGQQGRFSVAVWDGSFASELPARTSGLRPGQPVQFTVGEGDDPPSFRLTSFDGDIRIRRLP